MVIATTVLSLGAMTAQATTYGLDLTINSMNFDGTFDFTKSGTCTASSLLCSSGTPDFSKVNVSDGFNNNAFTQASLSQNGPGEHVTLYDLNGLPGLSSQVITLSFDINAPLGGPTTHFSLSDIVLNVNNNGNGIFRCGGSTPCTSSLKAVAAPEMDVVSTGGAVALLFASLAVLGGRRLRPRNRQ